MAAPDEYLHEAVVGAEHVERVQCRQRAHLLCDALAADHAGPSRSHVTLSTPGVMRQPHAELPA
jgi:hypothetical protein